MLHRWIGFTPFAFRERCRGRNEAVTKHVIGQNPRWCSFRLMADRSQETKLNEPAVNRRCSGSFLVRTTNVKLGE